MTEPSPRRRFVGSLIGGAAALAASPLLPLTEAAAQAGAAPQQTAWDMSWVDRLTGPHRMVFDAPEIAGGVVLHQARSWMAGHTEIYGAKDAEMHAVLVIRHSAVPMVMPDSYWEKYDIAAMIQESTKAAEPLKDPTTGEPTKRNPWINYKQGDRHWTTWPDAGLDTLIGRGAIVLACNLALRGMAGQFARKDGRPSAEVFAELRASLLPGVTVMPNGIFATGRAQAAGCGYIRAT